MGNSSLLAMHFFSDGAAANQTMLELEGGLVYPSTKN